VEDWFHGNGLAVPTSAWSYHSGRVVGNTHRLLELLSRHRVRGTFFVLGCVAQAQPGLVREIAAAGHELGVHGYWHRLVYRQTREEFRHELRQSRAAVEDASGVAVDWHRAPSWSIDQRNLWALEILEEEGIGHDSSIFPVRTPLFGMPGVPHHPFRPTVNGRQLRLWEFPPPPVRLCGLDIPFAGGLFLRLWPSWMGRAAIARLHRTGLGALVHTHPWEVDTEPVAAPVSFWRLWLHRVNRKTTMTKLDALLREFRFAPLGEVLAAFVAQQPDPGGRSHGE